MKQTAKIILIALAAVNTAVASTFTGSVERVIDGDTIVVGTNIVRLAEIDAPEIKTSYGPASKAALSNMILHKQVTVIWSRRGRYRRIIGQVYLDGEWINLWLVKKGWACQAQRYSRCDTLRSAEVHARCRKTGLWETPSKCGKTVAVLHQMQTTKIKR